MSVTSVLQMSHPLAAEPVVEPVRGVTLRCFSGPDDIDAWLDIRHQAFAKQQIGVRRWSRADFEAEILDKWWFKPECLWIAEATSLLGSSPNPVGTVTMAMRGDRANARPAVHWLAVLPSWRRKGIGRLLLATLERAAWDAGHRAVLLETHSAWSSALHLYEAAGYRTVM